MGWIIVGCWYIIGVMVVIHEMRHDRDIDLECIILSLICGVFGPLWLIGTICRNYRYVVFKRYESVEKEDIHLRRYSTYEPKEERDKRVSDALAYANKKTKVFNKKGT